jgi:hypothetical protein
MSAVFLRVCNVALTAGWVALFIIAARLFLRRAVRRTMMIRNPKSPALLLLSRMLQTTLQRFPILRSGTGRAENTVYSVRIAQRTLGLSTLRSGAKLCPMTLWVRQYGTETLLLKITTV